VSRLDEIRKLLWKVTPSSPGTPITPGRRSAGLWKAAHPRPAPGTLPQALENRFAVSHSPPAPTATSQTALYWNKKQERRSRDLKVDTFN
jgi:hypothetical protein